MEVNNKTLCHLQEQKQQLNKCQDFSQDKHFLMLYVGILQKAVPIANSVQLNLM